MKWEWRTNDWIWLAGILITIIGLLSTALYYDYQLAVEFITFAASILSIFLAIIAIFVTLIYSKDSKDLHSETAKTLASMTTKLSQLDKKVSNLDPKDITEPTEEMIMKVIRQEIGNVDPNKIDQLEGKVNKIFNELNKNLKFQYNKANSEYVIERSKIRNEIIDVLRDDLEGTLNLRKMIEIIAFRYKISFKEAFDLVNELELLGTVKVTDGKIKLVE